MNRQLTDGEREKLRKLSNELREIRNKELTKYSTVQRLNEVEFRVFEIKSKVSDRDERNYPQKESG